jgi:hypothetical protein
MVAAPGYLRTHPPIEEPSHLAKHQIIAMAHMPSSWPFASASGSSAPRTVQFVPRLVLNTVRAVVMSALSGTRRGEDLSCRRPFHSFATRKSVSRQARIHSDFDLAHVSHTRDAAKA